MALTSSQYQEIMRGYELTRDNNRKLLEARREEVCEKLPEYRELDAAVATYARSRIRLLLDAPEDAGKDAENPIPGIIARKKAMLENAGFAADYLDPIYDCPDCQDTGYVLLENGLREKCRCFRRKALRYLYEQSNLQGVLETDHFSKLSYEYCQGDDLEHLKGAVRISKEFAQHFPEGKNILFYGTVGTGKSFLSGCIANELLEKGFSVVYFSSVSLFETLARYSFDANAKEGLYNFCKELYNYDLVIVDDLGTELLSSFVTSQLFSLLNERELRHKSTIISTNLNLSELRDRYSDRVFSRVSRSFALCKLTGPDVRMCQKLNALS
jgi:DNA replication protein DnaC